MLLLICWLGAWERHKDAEDSATLEPESPAKLRSLSYRAGGYGPRHSSLNGSMYLLYHLGFLENHTTVLTVPSTNCGLHFIWICNGRGLLSSSAITSLPDSRL